MVQSFPLQHFVSSRCIVAKACGILAEIASGMLTLSTYAGHFPPRVSNPRAATCKVTPCFLPPAGIALLASQSRLEHLHEFASYRVA